MNNKRRSGAFAPRYESRWSGAFAPRYESRWSGAFAPRFFWAILILLAIPHPLPAAEPPVSAENAWVRAAPPGTLVLAGYMKLSNLSGADIALTGIVSPQFERVEMHKSVIEGGVAYMDKVEEIVIPAGGTVSLEPGGLHLMLINPQEEITQGEDVRLLLMLDDGWQLALTVPVRRDNAGPAHHH